MAKEKESLQGFANRRNQVEYAEYIFIPVGHILSVLFELIVEKNPKFLEKIKKPGFLEKTIKDLNEKISVGGNGFARITGLTGRGNEVSYGNKVSYGVSRYLSTLYHQRVIRKKDSDEIHKRVMEECSGIIPEDHISFRDQPS